MRFHAIGIACNTYWVIEIKSYLLNFQSHSLNKKLLKNSKNKKWKCEKLVRGKKELQPMQYCMRSQSLNFLSIIYKCCHFFIYFPRMFTNQSKFNKSLTKNFTFCFSQLLMDQYNWYIIRVVLMINPFESDITLITTCYLNKSWKILGIGQNRTIS